MKSKHKVWVHKVAWVLFILYIVVLFYFLFFSERYGRTMMNSDFRYNLVFFKEIKRFIEYREKLGLESFVVNIIGNIVAFSPFGFVLPIISVKNRKFLNVAFLSFELSFVIEFIQLVFKVGIFDVDDLIMNTIGGILGYLVFAISYKVMKRR